MTKKHRFIIFATLVVIMALGLAGSALALDDIPDARGTDWAGEYVGDFAPGFTDIGSLKPATQAAIESLAFYGITMGYSDHTYRPAAHVARWEMALFLARLVEYVAATTDLDLPATLDDPGFTDTAGLSAEAQEAIALLYTLDITKGTTATTFSPYMDVSRRDMASFMVRVQDLLEKDSYDTTKTFFTDVPSSLSRSEDINAIANQGIAVGYGNGMYGPHNPVLRAEMALFIMRHVDENVESGRIPVAVLPVDSTPVTMTVAAGEEYVVDATTYAQHADHRRRQLHRRPGRQGSHPHRQQHRDRRQAGDHARGRDRDHGAGNLDRQHRAHGHRREPGPLRHDGPPGRPARRIR